MKTFQQTCVCALLAALTALAVCAILFLRAATAVVAAVPGEVRATRAALLLEVQAARQDLTGQVDAARQDVLARSERQIDALRTDLMAEAAQVRLTADRRVGDTLARADLALGTALEVRGDVQPVLDAAGAALRDTDRTIADLRPQLLGLIAASKVTAGETAQTMRDVRGAVPGFLAQGQDIAANFQAATLRFSSVGDNLDRLTKPRWYDRLIGYGLNGVVIYRNLNPVTNLTVKGAQFLSGR